MLQYKIKKQGAYDEKNIKILIYERAKPIGHTISGGGYGEGAGRHIGRGMSTHEKNRREGEGTQQPKKML